MHTIFAGVIRAFFRCSSSSESILKMPKMRSKHDHHTKSHILTVIIVQIGMDNGLLFRFKRNIREITDFENR